MADLKAKMEDIVACEECRQNPSIVKKINEAIDKFYRGNFEGFMSGNISDITKLKNIIIWLAPCKHKTQLFF